MVMLLKEQQLPLLSPWLRGRELHSISLKFPQYHHSKASLSRQSSIGRHLCKTLQSITPKERDRENINIFQLGFMQQDHVIRCGRNGGADYRPPIRAVQPPSVHLLLVDFELAIMHQF